MQQAACDLWQSLAILPQANSLAYDFRAYRVDHPAMRDVLLDWRMTMRDASYPLQLCDYVSQCNDATNGAPTSKHGKHGVRPERQVYAREEQAK